MTLRRCNVNHRTNTHTHTHTHTHTDTSTSRQRYTYRSVAQMSVAVKNSVGIFSTTGPQKQKHKLCTFSIFLYEVDSFKKWLANYNNDLHWNRTARERCRRTIECVSSIVGRPRLLSSLTAPATRGVEKMQRHLPAKRVSVFFLFILTSIQDVQK
jgi:hypothetical protein